MGKVDFYICSKPLQYLNICNIPMEDSNKKILIVCDAFSHAHEFAENIRRHDKKWDNVIFVKGYNWVYYLLLSNVDKMYWGLDSTIVGLLHMIKKFKSFLYEEGAGTYRQLKVQSKYSFLNKITGTGVIMGRSRYLESIFVYHPDYYIDQIHPFCKVIPFKYPYREIIRIKTQSFLQLYGLRIETTPFLNVYNSSILLYITDWEYQKSTMDMMSMQLDNYDCLFIKPHPHIKVIDLPPIKGVEVIQSSIVVEIIISIWLENHNRVTVYHQDSTAIIPFKNEITAINVNENSSNEYRKIIEDLINMQ